MKFRSPRTKTAAGIAGLMLLAFPLAACGDDNESADKVQAVATIENLSGEQTEITVDQSFFDTLDALGVTPGVLSNAGLDGNVLSFPITGGNVSVFEPGSVPNYVVGQIQHENSGLSLTAGDITVELRNFNVDPTVSRVYGDVVVNGDVAATSAYLFRLNGSTLKPLQTEGDTAILEGTKVFISDVAAGLLNDTYGIDDVTDQVLVGVAKITVNTK
ncbi:hypothetical protein [Nocardioides sp.]|uniref:hypothetical protein n=1 Tax=Nocardioides sp. TaxID=35761 RepID=UPI002B2755C6|nr:hypothetical protein [Nocardioides sp.]